MSNDLEGYGEGSVVVGLRYVEGSVDADGSCGGGGDGDGVGGGVAGGEVCLRYGEDGEGGCEACDFAAVPEVFEDRAIVGLVGFQLIYVDFGSKLLEIEAF